MSRKNIVVHSLILLAFYMFLGSAVTAQIKSVAADSVGMNASDEVDEDALNRTIAHHEDIMSKYPDEPFIPNIMFELAELYVTSAELKFKRENAKYDSLMNLFDKGELLTEPILPRINLKKSIEICYKLLEKFPDTEYRDKILYRLGMCHLDEGNVEKAKEYFQKLVYECPKSDKISEAHFRLGEYYFAKRDFQKAIEHYKNNLDAWDDPFFNMTLYKLGWSYYNISDYANAISTYIYLMSDIKLLEELDTELLGKTKADVRNEAVEYIAHSFCDFSTPAVAKDMLKNKSTQEYAILVLEKMGEIYKSRNFYPEAVQTYQALLELYPFYQYAPNIQKEIIECYERDFKEELVIEAKETFVKDYGPDSPWMLNYPEGKVRQDALALVQEMIFSLGTYYQAKAQEKNREREYLLATEKYEDYLSKFKDSEKSDKVRFYLAESYYEVQQYDKAADEYFKVMTSPEESEFKDAAAYNRILAYYNQLKKMPRTDSLTFYIEEFLGESSQYPFAIKVANETQANLLKACNDYVRYLPDDEKKLEILMKYGEMLYELEQWELAGRVYMKVAQNEHKASPFYGTALNLVAQTYFKLGRYKDAEIWFEKVAEAFPDSNRYLEKSRKMIASANFKQAEEYEKSGQSLKAAAEFLKIAFSTADIEIAKASIQEAANAFEQGGDLERAVKCYERMIQEQPNISFVDELYMKAALLREKMQNWIKASKHYADLVEFRPKSTYAPIALFNAALCYENMKLWYKAKETYEQYIQKYGSDDTDKYIESQYKIGEICYLYIKNQQDATTAFQQTVDKYIELRRRGLDADEYLVAKAQYTIAEIYFDEFKRVRIVPPLRTSLKKKQDLLSKVLKAYIATGKFNIAEWTTASVYKTGVSFEEFCEAILSSPAPPNLTQEDIQKYYANLNQQFVTPFKEKALEFYKTNVANAEKNNITNEWTEESKKRMQALIVELGLGDSQTTPKTRLIANQKTDGGS
ncbi:tetratricopeptide repeat protein [candidate division KSB1 bacterium]|nr:tetratricopeptide repeat protein [candidate division KSB1 bacterium]